MSNSTGAITAINLQQKSKTELLQLMMTFIARVLFHVNVVLYLVP